MRALTKVVSTGLLVACAALLAGCGSDDDDTKSSSDGSSAGTTIAMKGNAFDPDTATVKAGESVSFENEDGYAHNVKSTSGESIDIGDFESGSESVTLKEAGTVEFECTLHEGMTGSIDVEDA